MVMMAMALALTAYLMAGVIYRCRMVSGSNGYSPGLISAVVCVTLWPLFQAAELNEFVKEKFS